MKRFLTLLLLCVAICSTAHSQHVQISFRTADSTRLLEDKVVGYNYKELFGEKSNYLLERVTEVIFYNRPAKTLQKILKEKGIKVVYRYPDHFYPAERAISEQQFNPLTSNSLRGTSKGFRVLGVGLMTGAIILSVTELKDGATLDDLERRQNLIKVLAGAGGFTLTIGILIE